MNAISTTRTVAVTAIILAFLVILAAVSAGFAAPSGISPFFYFVLISVGAGGFALLLSGVIVVAGRDGDPRLTQLEARARVRRGVLGMAICIVVLDVLGILLLLKIQRISGETPVSAGLSAVVFAAAAITVVCGIIASMVVRRALPAG